MFTAKVYKICIASASGTMKEERIAQDVLARWNCQHGEEKGVIIPSGSARSGSGCLCVPDRQLRRYRKD